MTDDVAYKIMTADQWTVLSGEGRFEGAPVDLADGYIHLSAGPQVAETAARHFAGRDGLMLVAVDIAACGAAVRWEVSRGGARFPHLYGVLAMERVLWAGAMPLGEDGRHVIALSPPGMGLGEGTR